MSPAVALSDLSAVVLAAGLSRRAAPHNKLLFPFGGDTVVRATVHAFCGAGLGEVLVVTGHQREPVEAALAGLPVRIVFAEDFAAGMGHSLAAGLRAVSSRARGFVVSPGDLPHLSPGLIRQIAGCFLAGNATRHVLPLAAGQRGHPVVLGPWLRSRLEALQSDAGARRLLTDPAERARTDFFEVGDPAICRDVDRADWEFRTFSRHTG